MKNILAILLILLFVSCTTEDDAGEGDFKLSISGGTALEEGFPYTENGTEYAFADDWTMQFTKYIVAIGDIKITDPDSGNEKGTYEAVTAIDLKKDDGSEKLITTINDLPAKRLDISFSVFPVSANVENRNVDEDDFNYMLENGLSYLVEGTAEKDGTEITFRFGLTVSTNYHDCINGVDQTKGIVVERNKTTGAYIYAHALHLFWDTLASGDEDLRFDTFAAVAGNDGIVTEEELKDQDLTDLHDENGDTLRDSDGNKVYYNDNGMLPYDDLTLEAFLNYAARAGVHFNGVGFCEYDNLDD